MIYLTAMDQDVELDIKSFIPKILKSKRCKRSNNHLNNSDYDKIFDLPDSEDFSYPFLRGPLKEYLSQNVLKPQSRLQELFKLLDDKVSVFYILNSRIYPFKFKSKKDLLNYISVNYIAEINSIKSEVRLKRKDYEYLTDADIKHLPSVKDKIDRLRSLIYLEECDLNLLIFNKVCIH